MKVSPYISGAVRQFAYWFAHGTLGHPLLEGVEYLDDTLKEESSFAEMAFAIFMNNLELDETGRETNYKYCERRAAQYIKHYFEPEYQVEPAFEAWELELYHYRE